ncbi:MAG: hypothetical protein ACE5J2_09230 [Nitrososphaerales archaeon]
MLTRREIDKMHIFMNAEIASRRKWKRLGVTDSEALAIQVLFNMLN